MANLASMRKKAISKLLEEGADVSEENIQATMTSGVDDDQDYEVADQLVKSLQSLRSKADLPRAVELMAKILNASLAGGFDKLSASFREHDHSITVNNPAPPPSISGPPVSETRQGQSFDLVFTRDMNGLIQSPIRIVMSDD